MNKEEAYYKIIQQKLWIDRAIRRCEYLCTEVNDMKRSLESARDDLSYTEEYLKKFQPKKELESNG